MTKKIFITGTDTDIGKTFVSKGVCLAASVDKKVGYYKPFQSGGYEKDGCLVAPDIAEFLDCPEVSTHCSYILKGEVSPYLASKLSGLEASVDKIKSDLEKFSNGKDLVVVEGAGGLLCPVLKNKTYADIIAELNLETIIVTTPDLGRLNHTLMTIKCAFYWGINVKGIIINRVPEDKTLSQKYFLEELKDFSDIQILAQIPVMKNPSKNEIIKEFQALSII